MLFELQVWVYAIKMFRCLGLVSTVGMIPVQNSDAFFKLGILLLGKNWNRVNRATLCLLAFVICMIGAFDWSVPAINPGKYWTHVSASFLPPC